MALEASPVDAIGRATGLPTSRKGAIREFERETGITLPPSPDELVRRGKKLALNEAKKLKDDLLKEAGLPDIPIPPLKDLTPEGVKDAVYAGAKPYLENAAASATGVPIKFPDKLSVKELEKMVGGLFPDDAIEALNLALSVGTQLAASALTSLLAGTAIGSVIPGLGTVVGLAVGLAVAGIKSLFTKVPTHSEGRECMYGFTMPKLSSDPIKAARQIEAAKHVKIKCPKPPKNVNAYQFFAWATREMQPLWDGLLKEQATRPCGRGEAINCVRGLNQMRDVAFWMSMNTVSSLGLPAVTKALAEVSKLPEISGGLNFVTGYRGTQPLSSAVVHRNQPVNTPKDLSEILRRITGGSAAITRGTHRLPEEKAGSLGYRPLEFGEYVSTKLLVQALRWRKEELEKFVQTARGIDALPAGGNVAPGLRFTLVAEFAKAGAQVQNRPDADSVGWFKTLWGFLKKLDEKQKQATKADTARAERQGKIAEERRKVDPRAAEISTARTGCRSGHQPSCAKLKELEAATVAKAVLKDVKAPPKVREAAKRVVAKAVLKDVKAPQKVKEAAKRVLSKATVSDMLIESTKTPEILRAFV